MTWWHPFGLVLPMWHTGDDRMTEKLGKHVEMIYEMVSTKAHMQLARLPKERMINT